MRLGKVIINVGYAVDLDDEEMVRQAGDAMYEDVMHAAKHDEVGSLITTEQAGGLLESDIPAWLQEDALEEMAG